MPFLTEKRKAVTIMREILFRGKNIDLEWIEGDLLQNGVDYKTAIRENKERRVERVICHTVGQYTGLTDKNGTKIFEGDIIAGAVRWLERMKNGVVAFRDGSYGLIWYRGDVEQFNPFTSMCNIEYEIIGNITDTPELLKGGEQE